MASTSASLPAKTSASAAEFWERFGSTAFSVRQLLRPDPWLQELQALRPAAPPLPRQALAAPGRVPVLTAPEEDLVQAFVGARHPVLLRDWAHRAGWGSVLEKWGLEFFEAEPRSQLKVSLDMGGQVRRRCALGEFIKSLRLSAPDHAYLRLWHYEEGCPELCEDFQVPECFRDGFDRLPAKSRPSKLPRWVFIGPEGAYTPLHTDPYATHAWFLQVRGSKRFELFHPSEVSRLSDGSCFADLREQSAGFPEAESVPRLLADVDEGDLLFLPADWPHTVLTTRGPSISLTHNFLDDFGLRVVRTAFLLYKSQSLLTAGDAEADTGS
eukprot:CAMPEP_0179097858 /NCGR_PEP_ID=MMETSP0796-20121207/45062_1 /TAXON_ID=73915 /ORGANISM="Pyrodinium bahamense, Strain pbaha01" /LENGTH=325 /DNA_ID=CAMNT_0020795613 /DNA_START=64 /DNA_END=1038 /DNA_ORIENTATION=+